DSIREAVRIFDMNRPISHIPKVELVKGDIMETADAFLKQNPHLVVAMLYLDFDLYEPTRKALEVFLPRMPKGAILAFDELNASIFPGETMAVDEVIGLRNLKIQRFPFDSYVSYAILD
ncbi:MAG TPA: class I SAM-dependent methyltransferase, partial [Alphaproteobacteria bacterium]|nr:class I SAM-dependent methyltransferase [Alphaproteobacteria bacterium]